MWSVKTSAWSVSGLKEIHRFERALRHAAKQNIFFSLTSNPLSHYFAFSLFLHKFANVNHVRNLIGWCRVWHLCPSANAEARRGWGTAAHEERFDCGNHLWIRRLLDALILTLGNFANFHRCQEWGNGRCPWVCNHQPAVYLIVYKVCQRCDIHTGVGFCVARSTTMGNAKASERGTSDGMTPTLFSYMYY